MNSVTETLAWYYLEKFRNTEFKARSITDLNSLSSNWQQ